jgi:Fe-S cluster biosynthesis and repair protein YggX
MLCGRCHKEGDPITQLPHGGTLGEEIRAKVCLPCWGEWSQESVRVINEHRLNLSEPAARAFLSTQMKIFLKLIEAPPPIALISLK